MHENKVIHRDIKPSNVFLTEDSHVKLGDLGASRFVDKKYDEEKIETYIGELSKLNSTSFI